MPSEEHIAYFEKKYSPGFFYGGRHRKDLRHLFEHYSFPVPDDERINILDIGFGSTDELLLIHEYFPRSIIVGLDVYKKKMKSLAQAIKEWNTISVLSGDLNSLDFNEHYFDLICAFNSLCFSEHLGETLGELERLLKKRRTLVFSFDIYDGHDSPNRQQYDKNGIRYLIPAESSIAEELNRLPFKEVDSYRSPVHGELTFVCHKK
ncbi:MAG: methyltransferase domain-containing protein [Candidatus Lokiarchaeota archaeon]|nr:methyltransferase domain-containing protein [Candidatus Lokiarchaeota archaeon]